MSDAEKLGLLYEAIDSIHEVVLRYFYDDETLQMSEHRATAFKFHLEKISDIIQDGLVEKEVWSG